MSRRGSTTLKGRVCSLLVLGAFSWCALSQLGTLGCSPHHIQLAELSSERIEVDISTPYLFNATGSFELHDFVMDAFDNIYLVVRDDAEAHSTLFSVDKDGGSRWSIDLPTALADDAGGDEELHLTLDPAGNLYLSGGFNSVIDFGTGAIGTPATDSGFVASFTSDGAPRWARAFSAWAGDSAWDEANSRLAVLRAEEWPRVSPTTPGMAGVRQLDGLGNTIATPSLPAHADRIAVASDLRWYVTGKAVAGDDLGAGALSGPSAFVIGLQDMTQIWQRNWEVPASTAAPVLVARDDGVHLGATYQTGNDLGSGALTVPDHPDALDPSLGSILLRYTETGMLASSGQMASSVNEHYSALALDDDDNLYAMGQFRGTWDLGAGHALESQCAPFAFGAVATGAFRWETALEDSEACDAQNIHAALTEDRDLVLAFKPRADQIEIRRLHPDMQRPGSDAWRYSCSKVKQLEDLLSTVSLERPVNASVSNETQPTIVATCLDALPGTLVRIFPTGLCQRAIGSSLIQGGGFEITAALQAIEQDGRHDGPVAFHATVEAPDGSILASCVDLELGYTLDSGSWTALSLTSAPSARASHATVWTGSEMLVWGGVNSLGDAQADGAAYDPLADEWQTLSTLGAPSARSRMASVWTGNEMLLWGGVASGSSLDTGARYTPSSDTWAVMSTLDAPSARSGAAVVWTGSEMFVWGGIDTPTVHGDGALYDPVDDEWRAISSSGAPSARFDASVVWTGTEVIVWGGASSAAFAELADGAAYNPVTDTWRTLSSPAWLPLESQHVAVWHAGIMYVVGGRAGSSTRLAYDPLSDEWSTLEALRVGVQADALSTGSALVVYGGVHSAAAEGWNERWQGGSYDPLTQRWRFLPLVGAPAARQDHSLVWTGTDLLVWGGLRTEGPPTALGTGARFTP